jgi:predicted RNA-binding protein (TIGR00451 family)
VTCITCDTVLSRDCSQGHIQIVVIGGEPLFFTTRDGPWCPTLRLVHKYPEIMKKLRVDTGAIKFVLAGADIMCPGLTSPGATIHDEVRSNKSTVSVFGFLQLIYALVMSWVLLSSHLGAWGVHVCQRMVWEGDVLGTTSYRTITPLNVVEEKTDYPLLLVSNLVERC